MHDFHNMCATSSEQKILYFTCVHKTDYALVGFLRLIVEVRQYQIHD